MRGERWKFNNQPAQERWRRNERGGDATTNQHERGAARGERRWRDKRGEGWYGKGVARAARQKAMRHDSK